MATISQTPSEGRARLQNCEIAKMRAIRARAQGKSTAVGGKTSTNKNVKKNKARHRSQKKGGLKHGKYLIGAGAFDLRISED